MVKKGKRILELFGKILPDLTDMEKEKLLVFGEGMAFMVDQRKRWDDIYNPADGWRRSQAQKAAWQDG